MENALAIFALLALIGLGAYWIRWQEKRDREKQEDDFFQDGSVHYDMLNKEIHAVKDPIKLFACESQLEYFVDKFYNHPCFPSYYKMLDQSLSLKEQEIIMNLN